MKRAMLAPFFTALRTINKYGVTNKGDNMTEQEFDKAVALVVEARKIIKALREVGLIKDSYHSIFNAGFNGMAKLLNKTKSQ